MGSQPVGKKVPPKEKDSAPKGHKLPKSIMLVADRRFQKVFEQPTMVLIAACQQFFLLLEAQLYKNKLRQCFEF